MSEVPSVPEHKVRHPKKRASQAKFLAALQQVAASCPRIGPRFATRGPRSRAGRVRDVFDQGGNLPRCGARNRGQNEKCPPRPKPGGRKKLVATYSRSRFADHSLPLRS
jgi:hypothetical protein